MADPNLLALASVTIDTDVLVVPTSMTDLIAAVAADSAINVEAIYCCNISQTVVGWITVVLKKGGTEYNLAFRQRISPKTTINALLGKPLYLGEGDSVRVQANATDNVTCLAPRSLLA